VCPIASRVPGMDGATAGKVDPGRRGAGRAPVSSTRAPARHGRAWGSPTPATVGAGVGDGHKGPLINGKTPFLRNNKTQTNPQIVKHTPHNHRPVQGGAHDTKNLSGPSSFRPGHPSSRSPPRSRAVRVRNPCTHSPTGALNAQTRREHPGQGRIPAMPSL
jgi:hypothetical protein